MPFINFTNVATMLLILVVFLLALVLSKETKKSGIIATMLSVFFNNSCLSCCWIGNNIKYYRRNALCNNKKYTSRFRIYIFIFYFIPMDGWNSSKSWK